MPSLFCSFESMLSIDPKELSVPVLQKYLQNAIAPRPICFASTISKNGEPNLAPFSFFNLFSSNPPIAVFSPAYSGRNRRSQRHLVECTRSAGMCDQHGEL